MTTDQTLQSILYVEDEPDIQQVVQLALETMGDFTVTVCSSGVEALERAPSLQPDLLLLDVMMPQIDGITTLQRLRELPHLAQTPVIFMTAKVQPDEVARCKELGALAVIAKPFDPMSLVQTIREAWGRRSAVPSPPAPAAPAAAASKGSFAERLAALTARFHAELPERLAELQAQWAQLERSWDGELLKEFHRTVHSLAGSGATFGLAEVSSLARALDVQLKTLGEPAGPPGAAAWRQIGAAFAVFVQALQAAVAGIERDGAALAPPAEPVSPAPHALVYVVGHGAAAAELRDQLCSYGYRAESCLGAAALTGQAERPAAVVLDGRGLGDAVYDQTAALQDREIPAVVVGEGGDFQARLRAVRAGALGFYPAPVDVPALVARLDQLTRERPREPYRVLLVDDEHTSLEYYTTMLEQAGMQVQGVSDPTRVMASLDEFAPEVVVADIYMPRVSGIELAMVIRQQERFDEVPIVFLSAENNLDKQLAALGMDADDFLVKPVAPERFVSVLSVRAQRARALRAAMIHDGLTGLLNHRGIKAVLEQEVLRSRRGGAALAVALLDIDHFKRVNDRYGHPVGDQVLRSLARLLQQRLRRSDHVGRYGGEQFLLILPDTSDTTACALMEELRAAFMRLAHRSESGEFTAGFSAGIAAATQASTAATLLGAADEALASAKAAGRGRIAVTPS